MPIYEYECISKCDEDKNCIFEIKQSINDKPLETYSCCYDKTKIKVKKIISQSTFHLKGSGWFKTNNPT